MSKPKRGSLSLDSTNVILSAGARMTPGQVSLFARLIDKWCDSGASMDGQRVQIVAETILAYTVLDQEGK